MKSYQTIGLVLLFICIIFGVSFCCLKLRPALDLSIIEAEKGSTVTYDLSGGHQTVIVVDDTHNVVLPWHCLLASGPKVLVIRNSHGEILWEGVVGRIYGKIFLRRYAHDRDMSKYSLEVR